MENINSENQHKVIYFLKKHKINSLTFVLLILISIVVGYTLLKRNDYWTNSTVNLPVSSPILDSAKNAALKNPCFDNYFNLGYQYYLNNQLVESIIATQKALEYNPQSAIAYNNLCSAYNTLGMWEKSIEMCSKSLELNPDFQLAKNNLNWAMEEKKKNK